MNNCSNQSYRGFILTLIVGLLLSALHTISDSRPLVSLKIGDRAEKAKQKTQQKLWGYCRFAAVTYPPKHLIFRVIKLEKRLEVWAEHFYTQKLVQIKSYPIASMSGTLGPKRREGDLQVPEGFYSVDKFNPNSRFHLSMSLNYPNASDRIRSNKLRPGFDIFIHGNKVSAGCLAMTDPIIEELYTLARLAKDGVKVHIYPFRMSRENLDSNGKRFPQHRSFWGELQTIYEEFEQSRKFSQIKVGVTGEYSLTRSRS